MPPSPAAHHRATRRNGRTTIKKLFTILSLAILTITCRAYERLQGPTELNYWDKTQTYNGYTFFGAQGTTYLLDMEGRVVHTWPVGTNPRLLDNGHVLDMTNATTFVQLDWTGSNVWSYTESRTGYYPHGDFLRIYNPKLGTNTTLYIANKSISSNLCIAAGCDPSAAPYTNVTVDAIVEVDPTGAVIWEWCFFDHGCQNFDVGKSNYVAVISNAVGRINLNLAGRPLTNDWLHCTSLDYNQSLDQIVITAEGGEFYVIDHGNTFSNGNPIASIALAASTTGDFLYRFGDPARYNAGSPPSIQLNWTVSRTGNKQIGGVGQTTWIPAGLPGAGHFLVFNSGQDLFETTPQSYIFEVNGYINFATNDTGAYVNPPLANYNNWTAPGHDTDKQTKSISRQVVSIFMSMASQAFFSHLGGSVQKLPNSNLLVCAAAEGHIFEVTPATNVVWEYISPITTTGIVAYKRDNWPLYNPVYRATRYSPAYAAFTNHTLTGSNTIANASPTYFSAPTISGTTQTPVTPYASNTISVTATITNNQAVSSATLNYIVGASTNTVAMVNTGAVYGAAIPAYAASTQVSYFISAQDNFGNTTTGALYSYTVQSSVTNLQPVITNITQSPATPTSLTPVTITALVTDAVGIASVTLTYSLGTSGSVTNPVFIETMATNSIKPWPGSGCNNAWTVTFSGSNPFEQSTNWNYGAGNPCGLQFKQGTSNLTDSMLATTLGITATGSAAYVEFYTWADSLTTNTGWTFQLNAGTGYVTRLSELIGTNHNYQLSHYDLQPSELVSNLTMRFQFAGGSSSNRISLDQISLKTVTTGSLSTNITMTLLSNGVYTAQITAQSLGTTVLYYITAQDSSGQVTIGTTTNYITAGGWSMLNLPDTGQILSYTGTFGEDADFAINPPAYTNNANGTITDLITGLMWQQTDGGQMTWATAVTYASTNTTGGYSDWRLPTAHELFSIANHGAFTPAINTNFFTITAAQNWWTRDLQAISVSNAWAVSATGGITPLLNSTAGVYVRCVRGASAPSTSSPIHHFTNNGNGTITDTDNRLTWQQAEVASATNWEGALAYASTNSLAGYTDWRLPSIKELRSLNDETLSTPSLDTTYFTKATAMRYWSSTTVNGTSNFAWCVDFQYGIATNADKSSNMLLRCVRGNTTNITSSFTAQYIRIPGGSFVMGDHFDYIDPMHYTDEVPLHNVYISPLYMDTTLATMSEYCAFLNAALYQGLIEVRNGIVSAVGGTNDYFYTASASSSSFIQYTNNSFVVLNSNNRLTRPVTSVRWFGAIAYCNWLSQQGKFKPCYNLDTGNVDFTKNGWRLPTEAEWEFCAHGALTNSVAGLPDSYAMFPWGTNSNANGTFANWQNSGDPFEVTNDYPNTTPVGFYNGALRSKSAFNWPGSQSTYQTSDGSCSYGLFDMGGNVWEWCNDWYMNIYYTNCVINNIVTNPPGPTVAQADLMPDNQPWRCLRGGTWWNGGDQTNFGYARISNRDPGYYLGGGPYPNDPYTSYSQTGFRVMRPEKLTQTVGLFLNTTNAYPGYTLMSPMQGTNTYLLNNKGQYVHKWTSQYNPGRADYLMENGHLMRACAIQQTVISTGGGEGGRLEEHDWLGNLVWVFSMDTATNLTHHDFKVLPNGNVLMIASEVKSYADVIAAGFNPALLVSAITTNGGFMLPDYLIEVQPTRPSGGNIVWQWHVWDHLIQDYDNTKNNYGIVSNHIELINANPPTGQAQQFWNHFNGIDYNPQLDQILISCRNNSELWIIDHSTTSQQATTHTGGKSGKGGDLIYRWGNPLQYKLGTQANEMLYQQHCCTWIPTNYPNAGHILIFNNGIGRGYTSVDEIVPPTIDGSNNYYRVAGTAFGPSSLYWTYHASVPTNFYCPDIGGAERQPNGNTLICYGILGNLFEVTTNGVTVWNYVNPETHTPLPQGSSIPPDPNQAGEYLNEVFKVHRYATNFVGLANKDLTPRGTVETYTGAATDTVGLGLPDSWVRTWFGSLSAVTSTSSHSGNGLTDIQEYNYGLNPLAWSSTSNGIPDGWAIAYGLDPTFAGNATNIALNGYTYLQSYLDGLNPTNPALYASFTATPTNGAAPLSVTFTDTSTGTITNRFWSFGDGGTTNTVSTNVVYTYLSAGTNTVTLTVSGPGGATSNSQTILVFNAIPTVSQQPVSATNCTGATASFAVGATGVNLSYQWQAAGTNLTTGGRYSGTTTTNLTISTVAGGDAVNYRCIVSNDGGSVTSAVVSLTVNTSVTPSVSVGASPGLTNCAGTAVIFTATPVNGGASPSYVWKKNGSLVGGSGNSYTYTPVNGDTIDCQLTSSATCVTTNLANATQLALVVNANVTPSVSVTANPGLTNCAGTSVTFTATPVNGGASPSYVWKKNSSVVGSGSVYTNANLVDGDRVDCQLISNAGCVTTNVANATSLVLVVSPLAVGGTAVANPSTVCSNSSTTVGLTGSTGTIQWQASLNNVTFSNLTSQTATNLTTGALTQTTYCRAIVTSGICGSATSTVAIVTVTAWGQLGVTPAQRDFGVLTNGTSQSLSFTVTNTGCGTISGTVTSGAPFAIVAGNPFNLSGYGATNVVVSFTPASVGNYTNMVIVTSTGGTVTNRVTGQSALVPIANFTATPTNGGIPLPVTFTDTSTGAITNRGWDFGDGQTTNGIFTSVSHTYVIAGSNTVRLIVTGPLGSSTSTQARAVIVNGLATVATPKITPAGGTFTNIATITLSCTNSSAKIYYTRDGSTPTTNSVLYGSAIVLSNSATIQALATKTGLNNSAIGSATFTIVYPPPLTISTASTLPVGLKGIAYRQTLQAFNGQQPYTWTATMLPAGLRLTSAGLFSGTPTKAGTTNFLVTVKDAATFKQTTNQWFSLTVVDPTLTFAPVMGTYTGLIIQTNNPTSASSGFIQIVLANSGSFAGNLTLAGVKTAYSGRFDLSGNATNTVAGNSVALDLGLGVNRGSIVGTVTGAGFTSTLLAELPDTSKTWTGKYTLALSPADVTVTNLPQGYGYATLTVSSTGSGSFSGTLSDGTTLTMAAPVSLYGHWPLYLSLYNKAGGCISWVTLTNGTVSGIVDWFAPASKYPAINTGLTLDGGLYTTGPALSNTWNLTFAGAGLTSNLVKTLTLSKLGTVVGTNPVAWSVTVSSGLFTGSFTPPGSKAIPFKGLLLQSDIAGFGFFLTNGLSGGVTVEPAGP